MIKEYKKLDEKLKADDRSLRWFWNKYVSLEVCTYPYLHGIVTGTYNAEKKKGLQVKEIINNYLAEK